MLRKPNAGGSVERPNRHYEHPVVVSREQARAADRTEAPLADLGRPIPPQHFFTLDGNGFARWEDINGVIALDASATCAMASPRFCWRVPDGETDGPAVTATTDRTLLAL